MRNWELFVFPISPRDAFELQSGKPLEKCLLDLKYWGIIGFVSEFELLALMTTLNTSKRDNEFLEENIPGTTTSRTKSTLLKVASDHYVSILRNLHTFNVFGGESSDLGRVRKLLE